MFMSVPVSGGATFSDLFHLGQNLRLLISFHPLLLIDSGSNFQMWKHHLDETVKTIYENLHIELLYTDEKQNFDDAIRAIECIDEILKEIEE